MIKGALGAPEAPKKEGHQIDTRFVLGQKFRNRKRYVHHRKVLKIWHITVFELKKSVHTIKSYYQKTKKNAHFFKNPNFSTKKLQNGLSWSNLNGFFYFFF